MIMVAKRIPASLSCSFVETDFRNRYSKATTPFPMILTGWERYEGSPIMKSRRNARMSTTRKIWLFIVSIAMQS
jgi:hypothetical protein